VKIQYLRAVRLREEYKQTGDTWGIWGICPLGSPKKQIEMASEIRNPEKSPLFGPADFIKTVTK